MSRRRWLILGSHVPANGGLGGMIRYTVEVTRSLEWRPDVEVHVHCRPDAVPFLADELTIAPERLHPAATGSTVRDSLIERFTLGRLSRSIDADVVFGSKQLVPRPLDRATRLLTVHDMLPFDRPGDFGSVKRVLLPSAYRHSIRDANVVACVSAAARERLLHHIPKAADRAIVVPNAMTSTLAEVQPRPIAQLQHRTFALLVGDRSHRKNAGFVVALWAQLTAMVPDAHLAMVGPPGWGRNEEIPELAALVEAGAVSELGRISDGELRWAYENARVTLCPSLLEGFGLPVVEALSLGCPTIISPDPAQVEAGGGDAMIVGLDDRPGWITAIADHVVDRRRVPARRHTRTWDDVAAELVASVSTAGAPISMDD